MELLRQRKNCGGGGKEEINETQWDVPKKKKGKMLEKALRILGQY